LGGADRRDQRPTIPIKGRHSLSNEFRDTSAIAAIVHGKSSLAARSR
jgi:hypothetical protein